MIYTRHLERLPLCLCIIIIYNKMSAAAKSDEFMISLPLLPAARSATVD